MNSDLHDLFFFKQMHTVTDLFFMTTCFARLSFHSYIFFEISFALWNSLLLACFIYILHFELFKYMYIFNLANLNLWCLNLNVNQQSNPHFSEFFSLWVGWGSIQRFGKPQFFPALCNQILTDFYVKWKRHKRLQYEYFSGTNMAPKGQKFCIMLIGLFIFLTLLIFLFF